jgi:two-component system, response regulator PdtaR
MTAGNKGKVLVVDDDRLVLATVTHGLAQAGFEVIDADNGDDAILLARQHKPDLALLDIRMEGKSGFDVAAYLREYCQIPFMFLSAFSDEATIAQVKALGAVTYLVKPLDVKQIVPAVEAAFASRGLHAQHHTASIEPAVPELPPQEAAPEPPVAEASTQVMPDPVTQTVALAIGIVMHRHSMGARQAQERLATQARSEGRTLEALAERLVHAQEVLATLGSLG